MPLKLSISRSVPQKRHSQELSFLFLMFPRLIWTLICLEWLTEISLLCEDGVGVLLTDLTDVRQAVVTGHEPPPIIHA